MLVLIVCCTDQSERSYQARKIWLYDIVIIFFSNSYSLYYCSFNFILWCNTATVCRHQAIFVFWEAWSIILLNWSSIAVLCNWFIKLENPGETEFLASARFCLNPVMFFWDKFKKAIPNDFHQNYPFSFPSELFAVFPFVYQRAACEQ